MIFFDVKKHPNGNWTTSEIENLRDLIEEGDISEAIFPIQNGGNFPAGSGNPIQQTVNSANEYLNGILGVPTEDYIRSINAGDF